VKLLGRKKVKGTAQSQGGAATATAGDTSPAMHSSNSGSSSSSSGAQTTAPKGRPTPKRSEAAKRKGPIAPAPMTAAQARARRKSLRGPKLSRAERKVDRVTRRAQMADRRERMMSGDDRYLLPRDQGPVRRYVRDLVDSRRNLLGLFMPSALGLMFFMLGIPQLQLYMSPAMILLMVLMMVDGIILARKVSKRIDEKFPDSTESRWKLGLYATGRATQLRRMRVPRPQVERGSRVG
jgi:hypothetical protein